MVSPDTALRRLLRETGKLLRPYGFEGEEPTWSRVESGGVARVGRTRVARTWTDGQQRIAFGLTLDAVPVAWWEYRTWLATRRGLPSTPLEETTGPGLVTAPPSFEAGALWTIGVDPEQPGHARQDDVEAIRDRLRHHVHGHARAALRLLDPEFHVEALLDITDPTPRVWEAVVVLLAADGPSARLEEAVRRLRHSAADRESVEQAVAYAEERAGASREFARTDGR